MLIKIACSGLVPLQGCWLHRCHLSSCCFDDKAKPLCEWRCVSSAYTEMHYAFAPFFLVPSELPQRPLTRGASKSCALSLTRHASHLHSACAVSKSARKPFVIKIEKQPAPVALKGRARWHEAAGKLASGDASKNDAFKNACHWSRFWLRIFNISN